ncbi:hypothetical protein psal_cds_793 [Pandoravirus salinus]|uniref:Uncharacterized protein n=1 Tax=Pandoravirus salinus TaxID=1349410 RepID=S4W3G3_9VIRU|nr:hypothetical protein psal_cds_793 [Pandoravirus salinus]AGO84810.1 hypothetical protein psal_cds_793 [Pandoravirus salinus]
MDAESLLPLELWHIILCRFSAHHLYLEFVCRAWATIRGPARLQGPIWHRNNAVAMAAANKALLLYALELDSSDLLAWALAKGLPCGHATIKDLVSSGRDHLAQKLALLRPRCARRYEKAVLRLRPQPLPRHAATWSPTKPMALVEFIDYTVGRLGQDDPDCYKLAQVDMDQHGPCLARIKQFVEGRWDALDRFTYRKINGHPVDASDMRLIPTRGGYERMLAHIVCRAHNLYSRRWVTKFRTTKVCRRCNEEMQIPDRGCCGSIACCGVCPSGCFGWGYKKRPIYHTPYDAVLVSTEPLPLTKRNLAQRRYQTPPYPATSADPKRRALPLQTRK